MSNTRQDLIRIVVENYEDIRQALTVGGGNRAATVILASHPKAKCRLNETDLKRVVIIADTIAHLQTEASNSAIKQLEYTIDLQRSHIEMLEKTIAQRNQEVQEMKEVMERVEQPKKRAKTPRVTAVDTAANWLTDLLKNEPVRASLVKVLSEEKGISWSVVRLAQKRLGVKTKKTVGGFHQWSLQKKGQYEQRNEDIQARVF